MTILFSCPIIEGYGQTESVGASFFTNTKDVNKGHCGGPTDIIDFKLISVPNLNYFVKNQELKKKILPQGEICLKGPSIFVGYYKD